MRRLVFSPKLTLAVVRRTIHSRQFGTPEIPPGLPYDFSRLVWRPCLRSVLVQEIGCAGRALSRFLFRCYSDPPIKNLVDLVGKLQKQRIQFKSLTDSIDTGTASGRFFFHVMASQAEMERELTIERTRADPQAARQLGRKGGRKLANGR